MGLFVDLKIDGSKLSSADVERLSKICPVDCFKAEGNRLQVDPENEDECILCYLCEQQAPAGGIKVVKTYEEFMAKK